MSFSNQSVAAKPVNTLTKSQLQVFSLQGGISILKIIEKKFHFRVNKNRNFDTTLWKVKKSSFSSSNLEIIILFHY